MGGNRSAASAEMDMDVCWATLETPIGLMRVASSVRGLCRVALPGEPETSFLAWLSRVFPAARISESAQANEKVIREIDSYFAGETRVFSVPLDMHGTAFQREVWRAVAAIPYGETRSYGQIAAEIGRPAACRAVGAANGANPLPPFVACHRVIGSDGSLTGYGGGLDMKARLLELERGPAGGQLSLCFA